MKGIAWPTEYSKASPKDADSNHNIFQIYFFSIYFKQPLVLEILR